MSKRNFRSSDAAAIAAQWYYGMFSNLYRFQCMARKNDVYGMDRDLLEGALLEIRECVNDMVYSPNKIADIAHSAIAELSPDDKNSLRELCLLRAFIRNLILNIDKLEDLVDECETLADDIDDIDEYDD
jgi:hypothetical protein